MMAWMRASDVSQFLYIGNVAAMYDQYNAFILRVATASLKVTGCSPALFIPV